MRDLMLIIVLICTFVLGMNEYVSWSCSSYQKTTGTESKYVDFDACYVMGEDGKFKRYDSTLRNNN